MKTFNIVLVLLLSIYCFGQKTVTIQLPKTETITIADTVVTTKHYFSTVQPLDTFGLWIDMSDTFDFSLKVREYKDGDWQHAGKYYYTIGKRVTDGLPINWVVTGQSNTFCSCNPSASVEGIGDTVTNTLIRMWNQTTVKWERPKVVGGANYGSSFGAVQHVLFFRKLTETLNRPVHYILYVAGGTPLSPTWDNNGVDIGSSAFFTYLDAQATASKIGEINNIFFAQSENGLGRAGSFATELKLFFNYMKTKPYIADNPKIIFQQSGQQTDAPSPFTDRQESVGYDRDGLVVLLPTDDIVLHPAESIHYSPSQHKILAERMYVLWHTTPISYYYTPYRALYQGTTNASGEITVTLPFSFRTSRYVVIVTYARNDARFCVVPYFYMTANSFRVILFNSNGTVVNSQAIEFFYVVYPI